MPFVFVNETDACTGTVAAAEQVTTAARCDGGEDQR